MKIYVQKQGKLEKFTDTKWLSTHNTYRYGNLKSYIFDADIPPVCNLCGAELIFQKKGKYINIISCSNDKCDVCSNKKGDIKLKAFLPENLYNDIKNDRQHVSYFNKDYLMCSKGMNEEDADMYIKKHKERISNTNKGHNKEYFLNKFGNSWSHTLRTRNRLCIEYWTSRGYTEDEAKTNISDMQKYNSSFVKSRHILSYDSFDNKDEAEIFFKKRSQYCIEYWLKNGYDYDTGKKEIAKLQSISSKKFWDNFYKNPEKYKYLFNTTIEYWISKGYSYEDAKKLQSKRQCTFSKKLCIQKYGKEKGLSIFNARQELWQKTLQSKLNYDDIVFRRTLCFQGYSKISQKLFDTIMKFYNNNDKEYVYYKLKNHEYFLRSSQSIYFYDFVDIQQRKIIEFNGDVWHANPTIFQENDTPFPFDNTLTSKQIWQKDKTKIDYALSNNFEILVIWEKDYRNNKENIINQCKHFLNLQNI